MLSDPCVGFVQNDISSIKLNAVYNSGDRQKPGLYTPLIEAIVNAIDSIKTGKIACGKITIILKREQTGVFEGVLPNINSIEVHDNGVGFTQANRDSFDTLYSLHKKRDFGGKGFGRFMFLKYFSDVKSCYWNSIKLNS